MITYECETEDGNRLYINPQQIVCFYTDKKLLRVVLTNGVVYTLSTRYTATDLDNWLQERA